MAELKSAIMGVLAILFVASAMLTVFSSALENNVNNGGSGDSVTFTLLNETAVYNAQMASYQQQLANSTQQASSTPSASLSTLGGIGALTLAGTAAISLAFSSVNILIMMVASMGVTLSALGVPPIVFMFGTIMVTVSLVFAIFAAVYKWWI